MASSLGRGLSSCCGQRAQHKAAAAGMVAEAPGRYNKQPKASEAVLPNLHPFPAKGGGGRSRGRSPLIAASITGYKWPRSRRYRAAFAETALAVSAFPRPSRAGHRQQVGRAQGCFGRSGIWSWAHSLPAREGASACFSLQAEGDKGDTSLGGWWGAASHTALGREFSSSGCQLWGAPWERLGAGRWR